MRSRSRAGYTLVEVLVVAVIFIIITTVVLADYRAASRRQQLRDAAEQVAAAIRLAKSKAYSNAPQEICGVDNRVCRSGSSCDAAYPAGCALQNVTHYGIKFNTDGNRTEYAIGADYIPDLQYDSRDTIPNGRMKLPKGFRFVSNWSGTAYGIWFAYDQWVHDPFGMHSQPVVDIEIEEIVSGKKIIVEFVTWSDTANIIEL
jgi:type II secretory pathway pseudopilin PulG